MIDSAATQSWLSMQTIVYFYQLIEKLISKSKHAAGRVVNLIQAKVQFIQNVNITQGRNQERQERTQSHHNQQRRRSGQKCAQVMSYVLLYSFFMLFAIFLIRLLSFRPSKFWEGSCESLFSCNWVVLSLQKNVATCDFLQNHPPSLLKGASHRRTLQMTIFPTWSFFAL